jgi:hypothetical protein
MVAVLVPLFVSLYILTKMSKGWRGGARGGSPRCPQATHTSADGTPTGGRPVTDRAVRVDGRAPTGAPPPGAPTLSSYLQDNLHGIACSGWTLTALARFSIGGLFLCALSDCHSGESVPIR